MPHVLRDQGVLNGTKLAVFLSFVHLTNDAVTAILGVLLPTLQQRFAAGPVLLAAIVATYSVASSFTQPLFGAIAEERGLRHVGALGVLATALFLSLTGVAPSLVVVFMLLIMGGMGSGALHPVGSAIVGSPTAPGRTLGVGLFSAGGMIGFAIGPVLILALLARYGVTATPWLMVPGIALGVGVLVLLPDWEPHRRRAGGRLLDVSLLRGPVGLLAAAGSLSSLAFITFTSAVPLWLVEEHGLAPDDPLLGWTLLAFGLSAAAGALSGSILTPRLGRRAVLVGSLLLAAIPMIATLVLQPGSVAYFAVVILSGGLLYLGTPIKVVVAQDAAPDQPAAAAGMVLGLTVGIAGMAYVILGHVQEIWGLGSGMAAGFLAVVPAAYLVLRLFRRYPQTAERDVGGRELGSATAPGARRSSAHRILDDSPRWSDA